MNNEVLRALSVVLILSFFVGCGVFPTPVGMGNKSTLNSSRYNAIPEDLAEKTQANYYFHNDYTDFVIELKTLNESYPAITDVYSLNAKYTHSNTVGGKEVWCIRITNESTGLHKPEVLFIGGHHGNERVGVENAFWYAQWLVTNYGKDTRVTSLVDNREIY
ncbi:hypothetical protein CEE45_16845, partial [Candidatus Heimdallarchaeota archaeon B3_Heim]